MEMFKKVLIANRGEIAVRFIQACLEMGIETIAVFSEADREALYVKLADEAYCIGPTASKDSYLNINNLMSLGTHAQVDAIHPRYGFLVKTPILQKFVRRVVLPLLVLTQKQLTRWGQRRLPGRP
jgi:acetyl-CoA carboxylase, biotin carboxylase subunit